MAFIVSAVVGFVGAAIGTAVGAAIGGTLLGISAATIGGVIGAGLAGGVLSAARGGSFGKGFLMGAAGGAIGGFLKGAFDGVTGVGGAAAAGSTDTVESMLASQGGADFAPTALEGGTGAGSALGADTGATTYGTGDLTAPPGTALDASGNTPATPSSTGDGSLASSATQGASDTGFSLGDYSGQPTAYNQPNGLAGLGTTGNATPDLSAYSGSGASPSPTLATSAYGDTSGSANTPTPTPSLGDTTGGAASAPVSNLDNAGANTTPDTGGDWSSQGRAVQPPDGTTSASITAGQQPAPQTGLAGMWDTAKTAWNENMPQGSLAKTVMGGGQYLMDQYNAHKLDRINKGMKPLTFDEYKQQYAPGQADRYAAASQQMAQSGHTGTLPILMANMNKDALAGYRQYLPGAQQQNLSNTAGIQAVKQRSLGNLFAGMGRTVTGAA